MHVGPDALDFEEIPLPPVVGTVRTTAHAARRCLLAAILVLAAAAGTAFGQYFGRNKVQYEDFPFHTLRTDHFDVYYYPSEKRAVRDAARMAERWHWRHRRSWRDTLTDRKPLVFYANDADFRQTNVIPGRISAGVGGVTESVKERVVMPLGGLYAQTDRVLGHELVHSFQYDHVINRPDSVSYEMGRVPTWWIEGMAEYLSLGTRDPHTALWLRDAVVHDRLPTVEELGSGDYFPYRFGHAYTAYVGARFGDTTVPEVFRRSGVVGLDSALVEVTGLHADSLSTAWISAVRERFEPILEDRISADSSGRPILTPESVDARRSFAPSLSPDGEYVSFISSRSWYRMNLYVADAETGEIVRELEPVGSTRHMDALRFLQSSGSWAPNGERLAFVGFDEGDNQIGILDVASGEIRRHLAPEGISAIHNVAWSPSGDRIAFSGKKSGRTDLFLLDPESGDLERITDDPYGELQPTWSPSGDRIAFTTDRAEDATSFRRLSFASTGLGVYDVSTGSIEVRRPFPDGAHHNPQFAPSGESLYFVSTHDGFSDVYRLDLSTGRRFRVTRLKTGVSGISQFSPAFTVARGAPRMLFTVFTKGEYHVYGRSGAAIRGEPVEPEVPAERSPAAWLPPADPERPGAVARVLDEYERGLPRTVPREGEAYDPDLSLARVRSPRLGVSTGRGFGPTVGGGVGLSFTDMLGNHTLSVVAHARGSAKDLGGKISYTDLGSQLNYGVSGAHVPRKLSYVTADRSAVDPETGETVPRVTRSIQRVFFERLIGRTSYPFGPNRRVELSAGAFRVAYDFEREISYLYPTGVRRETRELEDREPAPEYFASTALAYVGDYAQMGLTGPMMGTRYRFELSPQIGTRSYVTALADYRTYWYSDPFTLAFQGLHVGHYGAVTGRPSTTEYVGFAYGPGFVRGYDLGSFDPGACRLADGCGSIARLQGTRIAKTSLELRLPLVGPERVALIPFRYVPVQVAPFLDAGVAWTAETRPVLAPESATAARGPVVSAGLSTRINVLGRLVVETYWAYPFQRPDAGLQFGLRLMPGW